MDSWPIGIDFELTIIDPLKKFKFKFKSLDYNIYVGSYLGNLWNVDNERSKFFICCLRNIL